MWLLGVLLGIICGLLYFFARFWDMLIFTFIVYVGMILIGELMSIGCCFNVRILEKGVNDHETQAFKRARCTKLVPDGDE